MSRGPWKKKQPVFYRPGTPVLTQVCYKLGQKPRRPGKCQYTHEWMALLKTRRGRRHVNWACPRCRKCQHEWHANDINKRPCRACKVHPCAAHKCGHTICRDCGIGHGTIQVVGKFCESCRNFRAKAVAA